VGEYFLGLDGGQTSTVAWIGDETGRLIGRGSAGPCNHVGAAEGRARFTSAVNGSLTQACKDAGLDFAAVEFEAACFGFSGGPADKESLVREMVRAKKYAVSHDALIALAGATSGHPGIIVIAGTGSIAFGRNGKRDCARAGGWGYLFGDEGGAFDLVRQALRAALRFEEGWGPPTALHSMLIDVVGARDANDAMHRFYTADFPRERVAGYARLLEEAARNQDAVAIEILRRAGQELAGLAVAVRRQLFQPGEQARISYAGGVFRNPFVLERFRTLVELEDTNKAGPPDHEPAAGALLEAYRLANRGVALSLS